MADVAMSDAEVELEFSADRREGDIEGREDSSSRGQMSDTGSNPARESGSGDSPKLESDADSEPAPRFVSLDNVTDTIDPLLDEFINDGLNISLKDIYPILEAALEPEKVELKALRTYVKTYIARGGNDSDSSSSALSESSNPFSGSDTNSKQLGKRVVRKKKTNKKRRIIKKRSGNDDTSTNDGDSEYGLAGKPIRLAGKRKAPAPKDESSDDEGSAAERLMKSIASAKSLRRYCRALGVDVARLGSIELIREEQLDNALRVLKRIQAQLLIDSKLSTISGEQKDNDDTQDGKQEKLALAKRAYYQLATTKFCQHANCTSDLVEISSSTQVGRRAQAVYILKDMLVGDALVARFHDSHDEAFDFLAQECGLESIEPEALATCGTASDAWVRNAQSLKRTHRKAENSIGEDQGNQKEDQGNQKEDRDMVLDDDSPLFSQVFDLAFTMTRFGHHRYEKQRQLWSRFGESDVFFAVRPAACVASVLQNGFQPHPTCGPIVSQARGLVFFKTINDAVEHFQSRTSLKHPVNTLYAFAVEVFGGKAHQVSVVPQLCLSPPRGYHSIHVVGDCPKCLVFDPSQAIPLSFARLV